MRILTYVINRDKSKFEERSSRINKAYRVKILRLTFGCGIATTANYSFEKNRGTRRRIKVWDGRAMKNIDRIKRSLSPVVSAMDDGL